MKLVSERKLSKTNLAELLSRFLVEKIYVTGFYLNPTEIFYTRLFLR